MNKFVVSGASRFNPQEQKYLTSIGYKYFYELRDEEGLSYTIEKCVVVNNIGCIATNFELDMSKDYVEDAELNWKYNAVDGSKDVDWNYMHTLIGR